MDPKGSSVGIDVALLAEVCHCEGGLRALFCSSFTPCDSQFTSCCLQDVELSGTALAPCLPVC